MSTKPKRSDGEATADEIIDRLKRAVDVKNDAELAQLLAVSATTVSNWRSRNSVPIARIRPLCKQFAVPVDYLFSGKLGPDVAIAAPLDSELLGYVFRLLDRYGFISLPKARADYDPARRAAAEFALLQKQVAHLMQRLTAEEQMTRDQAKRTVLNRIKERSGK